MNETAFDTSYLVAMGVIPYHYTAHFRDEWIREHGAPYHFHLGLVYQDGSDRVHSVQIVGPDGCAIACIGLRNGHRDVSMASYCTTALGLHPHFWSHFESLAREFCKNQ